MGPLIRRICLALLGVVAVVTVYGVGMFVWEMKCSLPSSDAKRGLVLRVMRMEREELAASGRVGDIDGALRSPKQMAVIDDYRVVTSKTSNGYVVTIKPTSWCFCRPTYIIRDGGRQLEVVPAFF